MHWKHFTKWTHYEFSSWSENFNKKLSNTTLLVSFSGRVGFYRYSSSSFTCIRIQILFNDSDCSIPSSIHSGTLFHQANISMYLYLASPSIVSSECRGLAMGNVKITVSISLVCNNDGYGSLYVGNYYTSLGPTSYFLKVHELCPST